LQAVRDPYRESVYVSKEQYDRVDEPSFDLASAITEELGDFSVNSLAEIQKAEKKASDSNFVEGVEKAKREQYLETCYHLGIAQKEMGNFAKAIREFEQALVSESKRFQEVLGLLAGCYAEQGDFPQAIAVLQKGLDDSRCQDGVRLAILYDLAVLYEQSGEKEKSYPLYKEIYHMNPNFRDVAGKVKEIPYRKPLHGEGHTKEASVLSLDPAALKEKPAPVMKEKRRISYV
jgi:tetratricopeptide (TPR) repeat protein